jgi:hypothetical protein
MDIKEELSAILREIEIVSPAAIRFRGEMIPVQPAQAAPMPGFPQHPLPDMPLIREMQALLYGRCYSHRIDEPPQASAAPPDPGYVYKLAAQNRSRPGWEGGWMIYQTGTNGQIWIVKGDRQRTAVAGEYVTTGPPGIPPAAGAIVNVQVQRESMTAQPGFYFMYGETLADVWDDEGLVRFYFHASASGAPDLIGELTGRLNRYQVPFRMKALNDPAMYTRTDAIVLYVARRHHRITVQIVRDLPATVLDSLRSSTPLFTVALAPGIGVAEDPNTGESFGMHRCRLVAEGIVDALQGGDSSIQGRLRAVAARFEKNELQLETPHLGAGMTGLTLELPEVEFGHA